MTQKQYQRLSDSILKALELSLDQKDVAISDLLRRALDMALKRNAGERDYIDRRDNSEDIEKAVRKLEELRKSLRGS